jgi:hypothetical protein
MGARETGREREWTGFIWLRVPVAGSCEHHKEPSFSIKDDEFPEYLSRLLVSEGGLCCMQLLT